MDALHPQLWVLIMMLGIMIVYAFREMKSLENTRLLRCTKNWFPISRPRTIVARIYNVIHTTL